MWGGSRGQHQPGSQLGLGGGREGGKQVAGGHKNMMCHERVPRGEWVIRSHSLLFSS